MPGLFDNIHDGLDQQGAVDILSKDVGVLESESDYYMAVSHLINFPGPITSQALLAFLDKCSVDVPVGLAQRKAVEVLARLGVVEATSKIATFLGSSDVYMVENAAWALSCLNCQDPEVHQRMIDLLYDSSQNQRVLIQSLSKLSVKSAIAPISVYTAHEKTSVRGAAIAAMIHLSGDQSHLTDLSDHLYDSNQMDRQSAVQDVIDANAVQLLSELLQAPISPAFRMRAVRALFDHPSNKLSDDEAISAVDQLLYDDPRLITVLHHYGESMPTQLLIEGLFHPDFSRCYLAMQELLKRDNREIWSSVESCWQEKAHNDYGAHYFLMRLFGLVEGWTEEALLQIHKILSDAIVDKRPQFRKSPSAALLSFAKLFPSQCNCFLENCLSLENSLSWDMRYAGLLLIQSDHSDDLQLRYQLQLQQLVESDVDSLLQLKAQSLLDHG
ncbi:HEAT repeat domain-containing protein [Synechococcus sp. KORDI-52]|uniref:HEAT repeat domain-containing protein n=1 Tax=Synechococcus sp. KORDI-52 TaxID=585425 RepID=UPI0008FF9EB5|nr:bilin biosynthesis protein CpeY [Synechococcus sp. KORDI-52]